MEFKLHSVIFKNLLTNLFHHSLLDYTNCCNYYKKKFKQWNSIEPYNLIEYIQTNNVDGISREFKQESEFKEIICNFLSMYAKGREKDQLLSILDNTFEVAKGNVYPLIIDILIGATLKACGRDRESNNLILIGLISGIIGGLLLYSSLTQEKPKKKNITISKSKKKK